MSEPLLNEMGWEAVANLRLKRLEEVNEENERLRAQIKDAADRAHYIELYCREALEK